MSINWKPVLIAGFWAELLHLTLYLISKRYAGSAFQVLIYFDWFIPLLLGGLWIARKTGSRFLLHGVLVGIAANLIFVILHVPLWLYRLPSGQYWIKCGASFIVKTLGSVAGAIVGGKRNIGAG